jgi:hypothetical protein
VNKIQLDALVRESTRLTIYYFNVAPLRKQGYPRIMIFQVNGFGALQICLSLKFGGLGGIGGMDTDKTLNPLPEMKQEDNVTCYFI